MTDPRRKKRRREEYKRRQYISEANTTKESLSMRFLTIKYVAFTLRDKAQKEHRKEEQIPPGEAGEGIPAEGAFESVPSKS